MHFCLKFANNNHIGIFYVFVNELMLATSDNPGPLPSRSSIRQILTAEAIATGEVSCLACILANKPWQIPYENIIYLGRFHWFELKFRVSQTDQPRALPLVQTSSAATTLDYFGLTNSLALRGWPSHSH